jgi:hypothetical protein
MTILENELHGLQHRRQRHHKKLRRGNDDIRAQRSKRKQYALDAPLSVLHDDQVLTFFEWCQLIPILTLSNPWLPSRGVRWT